MDSLQIYKEAWQKRGGVFEGVDTLMHTMSKVGGGMGDFKKWGDDFEMGRGWYPFADYGIYEWINFSMNYLIQ